MIFLLVLISRCADDDVLNNLENTEDSLQELQTDLYDGGTQLANPYTVTNMRRAMDTIEAKLERGVYTSKVTNGQRSNASVIDGVDIQTTHIYVKFTPQDEEDLSLIKRDSNILVSDYPLDMEFSESWHANRPELGEGQIPEYFASIPASRSVPSVSYQVLDNLYIPEDEPYFNPIEEQPITRQSEINTEEDLLHHLLYEAYVNVGREQELLTDNGSFDDPNGGNRFLIFGRRWTPSGRLQVWDSVVGETAGADVCIYTSTIDYSGCYDDDGTFLDCPEYIMGTECTPGPGTPGSMIGLRGAQVLMRQLFTVRQAITNADGTFTTGTVRGRARYVVQWERYHYSIREGLVFQAEMRGPSERFTPWFKNISGPGGRDHYHANIHLGALNYYYGNRLGTISPPRNSSFKNQMKIAALGVDGQSLHFPFANFIPGPGPIFPSIYFLNINESAERIFGSITHELAHAAHRELDLLSYSELVWQGYILNGVSANPQAVAHRRARRLLETWATTVEVALTVDRYQNEQGVAGYEYRDTDPTNPNVRGNFQRRRIIDNAFYTSGGWDMIDDFNQGGNGRPVDNVEGYTLSQLEDALDGQQTWIQWRNRIIQLHNNNTEGNLVELFNNWQD